MKEKIKGLIITGGVMDYEFADVYLKNQSYDHIIAVDSGLLAVNRLNLKPDAIVGDFDSVDPDIFLEYQSSSDEITWDIHKPEKDETDTELGINTALLLGCTDLTLLGAMGGRMDHSLGNIHLLYDCLKRGVMASIIDSKNRITVLDRKRWFHAEQVWGKYISFLPLTMEVHGITLTGFKYPLRKRDITIGKSLCISNELISEAGSIDFDSGVLICVESHD